MSTITDQERRELHDMRKRIAEVEARMSELRLDMQERTGELRVELAKMRADDQIRRSNRTMWWAVIALLAMPQVVAEILSKF